MKIRSFYSIESQVYKCRIVTEDWSEGDKLLMETYGQPEISTGGSFTDGEDITFTLPDRSQQILSDSPFSQGFDKRDIVDAKVHAEVWGLAIKARITAAIATLRAEDDDFTHEEVTEV